VPVAALGPPRQLLIGIAHILVEVKKPWQARRSRPRVGRHAHRRRVSMADSARPVGGEKNRPRKIWHYGRLGLLRGAGDRFRSASKGSCRMVGDSTAPIKARVVRSEAMWIPRQEMEARFPRSRVEMYSKYTTTALARAEQRPEKPCANWESTPASPSLPGYPRE